MNILEVTEDKIFKVLGKGRDPNYKPIDKDTIDKDSLNKKGKPFDFSQLLK